MAKVNTANIVVRLIKRTCGTCTHPHVLLKLYIHLVRPHVEFASQVWSPHQQFLIDLIERIQRRASKLIIKDRPYRERLQELNLLSLASRRLFMDLGGIWPSGGVQSRAGMSSTMPDVSTTSAIVIFRDSSSLSSFLWGGSVDEQLERWTCNSEAPSSWPALTVSWICSW